jgi:hypothetical protein
MVFAEMVGLGPSAAADGPMRGGQCGRMDTQMWAVQTDGQMKKTGPHVDAKRPPKKPPGRATNWSDLKELVLPFLQKTKAAGCKVEKVRCGNAGENKALEDACIKAGMNAEFECTAPGAPSWSKLQAHFVCVLFREFVKRLQRLLVWLPRTSQETFPRLAIKLPNCQVKSGCSWLKLVSTCVVIVTGLPNILGHPWELPP